MQTRGSIVLLLLTMSCTAGQVVDDKTNLAIPNVYVGFVDRTAGHLHLVRASTNGQFAFDAEASTTSGSTSNDWLPEGDYDVFTGTKTHCGPTDIVWEQSTPATFHHSYDTRCKGSNGGDEPCEYYQIRISKTAPSLLGGPGPVLSDDHKGTRVILVTPPNVPLWPAPLPCD